MPGVQCGFSPAVEPKLAKRNGVHVSPKVVRHVIASESEEGGRIAGQKVVHKLSKADQKTHIPFRNWCPHCVRGKCKGARHKKGEKSEEEKEHEVPVISLDYMGRWTKGEWPQRVAS